jgi:hypothetical protein
MTNRHTILQVLPRLVSGGVERGTVEITDAIRKAGMKSIVVSNGGPMIPHITYNGGEHIQLPRTREKTVPHMEERREAGADHQT